MTLFPYKSSATWTRALKFAADLAIWTAIVPLAFLLRQAFDFGAIRLTVVIGLFVNSSIILLFHIERRSWTRSTVQDLIALASVVAIGTVVMFVAGVYLNSHGGFPRTVPLIAGTLAFLGMGGARIAARLYREERARSGRDDAARVLLVGAGEAGSRMVREMRRHPAAGLAPVGYLDDDLEKAGLRISGAPVLGTVERMADVARAEGVDEVLITMPVASGRQTRHVVERAAAAGLRCRILPGLAQVLSADVDFSDIRPVEVQDLLRREPVELDVVGLDAYIRDAVVLVTGAGGSIGSEIVRQIARFAPARVVLLGRGENPLHELESDLAARCPNLNYVTVVGNVCDTRKMEQVFSIHSPDIVFHTAAHKHVPMMQYNPDEAILNNVGGTRTLAEAALVSGTRRYVNVSTDKAVDPVSIMGCTKFLAEQLVRLLSEDCHDDQAFVSVRFGNVLGSRGSVVPVFEEQIRRGGPITITDPEATRYFMTISEAARLVMEAGASADNGSVYVLDMGEPVKIVDLARDLVRLSGTAEDIAFVFTGMRPGEKLHEGLFAKGERSVPTRHEQILAARGTFVPPEQLLDGVDELLSVAAERDWVGIDRVMASLVPGYGVMLGRALGASGRI